MPQNNAINKRRNRKSKHKQRGKSDETNYDEVEEIYKRPPV